MMAAQPFLHLDHITFSYLHGEPVFADFDWQVNRSEAWAVIGPSGCGKSTLLYLVDGLRFPSVGEIRVDGEPVTRPRPRTGFIIQEYGLMPWATVRENAALGLRIRNFYGPDGTHAPLGYQPTTDVSAWLERLGLAEIQNKYPGQISGGQRQRTAIARTLALQPDLLLMDEPFSSLDAPTRENLQRLTLELSAEQSLTLIIVTHAIEEAAVLGEKILLLSRPPNRGAAVVIENPGALRPNYRDSDDYRQVCRELRARLGEA
jgi:NitT/TauT family transport system ATP-binding protein